MSISEVVSAVLFANGLTVALIYAVWRLRRDEGDLKAIGLAIACLVVMIVIAWPTSPP